MREETADAADGADERFVTCTFARACFPASLKSLLRCSASAVSSALDRFFPAFFLQLTRAAICLGFFRRFSDSGMVFSASAAGELVGAVCLLQQWMA